MQQNQLKAVIRSLTPWVLSALIAVIQRFGFHVSAVQAGKVAVIVGTLVTIGAHYLETKWKWFGVLLGWVGAPQFDKMVTKSQQIAKLQEEIASLASGTPLVLSPVTTTSSAGATLYVPGAPLTVSVDTPAPVVETPLPADVLNVLNVPNVPVAPVIEPTPPVA